MPCEASAITFLATTSTNGSSGLSMFKIVRISLKAAVIIAIVLGPNDAPATYFLIDMLPPKKVLRLPR